MHLFQKTKNDLIFEGVGLSQNQTEEIQKSVFSNRQKEKKVDMPFKQEKITMNSGKKIRTEKMVFHLKTFQETHH